MHISRRTVIGLGAATLGALVAPGLAHGQAATTQIPKLQFEVKSGTKGIRFLLKAANGKTLVSSEHYKNKADCLHAIDLIKRGAATATIEDLAP
jgi:uncharacterized protein YegP (UPF0339 family)